METVASQLVPQGRAATSQSAPRVRGVELRKKRRARRSNDPFAGISVNTARGRRTADLVAAYLQALRNPPEIERQAEAIAAAELQVLAEEARALALKQVGHADLDQVIRLQGAADRAVRKLGLDRKREPEGPTLSQYLTDRYGAGRPAGEVQPDPAPTLPEKMRLRVSLLRPLRSHLAGCCRERRRWPRHVSDRETHRHCCIARPHGCR
jgi:hypothetical protein